MITKKLLKERIEEINYFIKFEKIAIKIITSMKKDKFPTNKLISEVLGKNERLNKLDHKFLKQSQILSLFDGIDDGFEPEWSKEQNLNEFEICLSFWNGQLQMVEELIEEL